MWWRWTPPADGEKLAHREEHGPLQPSRPALGGYVEGAHGVQSSRVAERGKNWLWQLNEDVKTLLENGALDGRHAVL